MQHKRRPIERMLVLVLFTVALIAVGWQAFGMARAGVDRGSVIAGWFLVVACGGNLVWLGWWLVTGAMAYRRRSGGVA